MVITSVREWRVIGLSGNELVDHGVQPATD